MDLLKMFIGLLTSIVNASKRKKCASLSNKKCTTQLTLINIRPNEYTQGLCYYVFVINLDKYVRSCNTLNDLSKNVYVPNAIEDLNLNVFNMITGINESKTLTKHIPCKCKFRFDGRKCNSDQKGNNDKRQCKWKVWKNITCAKKIVFEILLHVVEIMVNISKVLLMIQWLHLTKLSKKQKLFQQKQFQQMFAKKKIICKTSITSNRYLYFLHLFINFRKIVDSCYYLLLLNEILRKQEYLLPYHVTNNELEKVFFINKCIISI